MPTCTTYEAIWTPRSFSIGYPATECGEPLRVGANEIPKYRPAGIPDFAGVPRSSRPSNWQSAELCIMRSNPSHSFGDEEGYSLPGHAREYSSDRQAAEPDLPSRLAKPRPLDAKSTIWLPMLAMGRRSAIMNLRQARSNPETGVVEPNFQGSRSGLRDYAGPKRRIRVRRS